MARARRDWPLSDLAFLVANYRDRGPSACARVIGTSPAEVVRKAREVGIDVTRGRWRVIEGGGR